ncbi:serine O-acetyltransferase [Candidatus Pantoea edessiphila]|uniref:Serine acetyltransferase n=1 Tax=Candidatus Pantoea edessiphila TaxID=2044610 RepID=A0A2P5T293_9GAMM|nr:serine O-acetyltransferase [Candidatus Pantoea edessiphila]PPI88709.1 serine O-acetyltransferase [Candidatus Pantoea edessiphila]
MFFDLLEIIWTHIKSEAFIISNREPILADFYYKTLLRHENFINAQSYILANKLSNFIMPTINMQEIIKEVYNDDISIIISSAYDIQAILQRDPAVNKYSVPLLYLKGFQALQLYRISHWLWNKGRYTLAVYLQNEISTSFSVDIHPAAKIGHGIMLDHATGIVIGETAVIDNDVSILQSVTLGGTGKVVGNRHPKIHEGVMIGAGAKILGNIEIGKGAKIGAGSVVLKNIPPNTTAAGIPARIIGKSGSKKPSMEMDQYFNSLEFQLGDGI